MGQPNDTRIETTILALAQTTTVTPKDPRIDKAETALAAATLAYDRAVLGRDKLKLALDGGEPGVRGAFDEAEKLVRERERAVAEAKIALRTVELDVRQGALESKAAPAAQTPTAQAAPAQPQRSRPVTEYPKKLDELLPLAEKGDPVAQCLVGEWLSQGVGVKVDREEAKKWFGRSAAQGYPRGQALHGDWLDQVKVEDKLKLYRVAAAQGDPFGNAYAGRGLLGRRRRRSQSGGGPAPVQIKASPPALRAGG